LGQLVEEAKPEEFGMKKTFGVGVGVLIAVVALVAARAGGEDDIKAQIEAANRGFMEVFGKNDAAGVAACYTADAQLFPAGQDVVKLNAAIEAYWKAAMPAEGALNVTLTTLEAEQHGDTAIEVGRATIADAKGKTLDIAKYIVIWKRAGGKWKLHRDIFNTNLPPAGN
jgi:ketosteroid isomerase-like protein